MPGSVFGATKKSMPLKMREMRSEEGATVGKDARRLNRRETRGRAKRGGPSDLTRRRRWREGREAAKRRGSWKLTEAAGTKKRQEKISWGGARMKDNERENYEVGVAG